MKRLIAVIISVLLLVCLVGCRDSTNTNGVPDPEKIVPKRDVLMEIWKTVNMRLQRTQPLKALI